MEITVDGRKKRVNAAKSVGELLAALSINREEALVKVNGRLAPDSAEISGKDDVKVMRIIFGG